MALEPVTPSEPLTKAEWTCPMHSEIIRVAPGSCPICGMALEPKTITAEEEENPELINMTRRFKFSVVLTVPLVFIAMRHYIPGLTAIDRIIPAGIMKWFELILAAPVVLWVAFTYQSTLIYVLTRGDARLLICGQH
jgi:Cu+-exporting ATPase